MLYHVKALIIVEYYECMGGKEGKDIKNTPSKYDKVLSGSSVLIM